MNNRRAIIGLCMLCALAFSALAAQSASAATKGTTAFTCKKPVAGDPDPVGVPFSKAHCKDKEGDFDTSASGAFRHIPFAEKTTTDLKVTGEGTGAATNETTIQRFHTTIAGAPITLDGEVSATQGGLENLTESGEHYIHVHNLKLKYVNVKETLLGCEINGKPSGASVIETTELTATTAGQGNAVLIKPEGVAGMFAEFTLTGPAGCPGLVKVFGSVKAEVNGATVSSTKAGVTAEKR